MAFNTSIGLESAVKVLDALMHGQVLIPGAIPYCINHPTACTEAGLQTGALAELR